MPQISAAHLGEFLAFANNYADLARTRVLELVKSELKTEFKADSSPVTIVDRELEVLFRERLSQHFPDHGVIGEEFGNDKIEAPYVWTVDPIDGTENLINRQASYGILIGLRIEGEAVLGVIDHPEIAGGSRLYGGKGLGVRYNGALLPPLQQLMKDPSQEIVAFSSYRNFERCDKSGWLNSLLPKFQHSRMLHACESHSLALRGQLGAVIEADLSIWDITPAEALIPEVGGIFYEISADVDRLKLKNRHIIFGKPGVVSAISNELNLANGM